MHANYVTFDAPMRPLLSSAELNFSKDVTRADCHVEVTRSQNVADHASISLNLGPPSILPLPSTWLLAETCGPYA